MQMFRALPFFSGICSLTTHLQGPQGSFAIRESFICLLDGLMYCISCRRCPAKSAPGFPVAEQFNPNGHSADDAHVCGVNSNTTYNKFAAETSKGNGRRCPSFFHLGHVSRAA